MTAAIAIIVFFVYSSPNGGPDPFGINKKKEETKIERSIDKEDSNTNKEKQQ